LPADPLELRHEVLRLRDELIGVRALLAEAEVVIKRYMERESIGSSLTPEAHVEYLKGVVDDLELRLAATRSSATWRIGRVILFPLHFARRLAGRV
jgi:hypothetical protein